MKVSCKLILWWGKVKHSQSSQNSKFAMFLQYLKEEVRDKADLNTLGIKISRNVVLSLYMGIILKYSK